MKEIGIIRGVFDPIHRGHENAIKNALEDLSLSKLYIAVKFIGEKEPIASVEQRINMIKLQLEDYDSSIEIVKQNVKGHLTELLKLSRKYNSNIINICGSDKIKREIEVYGKEGDKFGVICRPEFEIGHDIYKTAYKLGIELHEITPLFSTSSTNIRKQLLENLSFEKGLNSKVLRYIDENNLYKKRNNIDEDIFINKWYIFINNLSYNFPELNLLEIEPPLFDPMQHEKSRWEKFVRTILKIRSLEGEELLKFISIAEDLKKDLLN